MDDLISRQAVNDMLKELTKKASGRATLFNSAYAYYRGAISDVYYWVKELPSVQPEVIRCEDCKWRRNRNGTMAWIPCRALVTPDDFYCKYAERKEQ